MDVFPSLSGLTWDLAKQPEFASIAVRSPSLRDRRFPEQVFPLYTFTLTYDVLREDTASDLKTLLGFFLKQNGSLRAFLYLDPSDSVADGVQFGEGDGVTTQFQLVRAYGGGGFAFVEPVQNVLAITSVKDNGVIVPPTTGSPHYTVSSTGLITFSAAPAAGHLLTWTGTFYYRVRFVLDTTDFNEFMSQLWENRQLQFLGAAGNMV